MTGGSDCPGCLLTTTVNPSRPATRRLTVPDPLRTFLDGRGPHTLTGAAHAARCPAPKNRRRRRDNLNQERHRTTSSQRTTNVTVNFKTTARPLAPLHGGGAPRRDRIPGAVFDSVLQAPGYPEHQARAADPRAPAPDHQSFAVLEPADAAAVPVSGYIASCSGPIFPCLLSSGRASA